jgi:hypothetical protein
MTGPHVRTGVTHLIMPNRPEGSPSGTELMRQIQDIMGNPIGLSAGELASRRAQVEELIFRNVRAGNVPDFMRPENYREITLERTIGGRRIQATVRVCPDYVAIGSTDDPLIVSLSAPVAQRIADTFGLSLPTSMLVDVIDDEAKRTGGYLPFHAAPELASHTTNSRTGRPVIAGDGAFKWNPRLYGFYEGRWMMSAEFIAESNRLNERDRGAAGNPSGLRSGHRKDVVYDALNYHEANEGGQPVVIYHKGIQGLSNQHYVAYFDYSHGIRLIDGNVSLTITEADGRVSRETRTVAEILNDPHLYQLLGHNRVDITHLYRGENITLVPRRRREPEAVAR